MKFKFLSLAFVAAIVCVSCSDSKTDEPNGGEGEQTGTLSPEQTKVFIEQTAEKAADMCNPRQQEQVIALGAYVSDNYGDLEFPDFDIAGSASHAKGINPGRMLGKMVKALKEGNYSRAAAELTVYNISFADIKGIYTPGRYSWERTGNSENVVIRCQGPRGQVEMVIKPSSQEHFITFDITDEDYDWWNGYYEYTDRYNINYPAQLTITVTEAGRELVNLRTAQMVSEADHKFVAKVTGNIMNINVTTENEGSDSRITSRSRVEIDGKLFAKADASLNGRRLCDIDNYENIFDRAEDTEDEEYFIADKLLSLVNEAYVNTDVLGDIQVKAAIPSGSALRSAVLAGWETDDEDGAAYREFASKVNGAFSAKFYVNGSSDAEGDMYFRADKFSESSYWYEYTYWELVPVFRFYSDGSVYTFEDYFAYGRFHSLTNIVEDVVDSYARIWNYYWR